MIIASIKKLLRIALLVSILIGTLSATPAFAIDCTKEYCSLVTIPGATTACSSDASGAITCSGGTTNPVGVVKNIYGISIGVAAVLAVIMIIWAGIEYATVESITGHSDAKEKWQGAIWGLLLLLSSYLILRTINLSLVNINLDLGKPVVDKNNLVSGGALQALNDLVALNALAVERAQAAVGTAQGTVTNLQAQVDAMHAQVAAFPDKNSAQYRALVAQGADLETQLANAKQTELTARATVVSNTLSQRSTGALTNVIKDVLGSDDATSVSITGYHLAQDAKTVMAQDIATLETMHAPDSIINSATARQDATNAILDKSFEARSVFKTAESSHNGDSYWFSSDVVEKRNALITSLSGITSAAATKDPENRSTYQQSNTAIINGMDAGLAKSLHCSKGISVSLNKIECAS